MAFHPVNGHHWEEYGFVVLSPIIQVICENVKQYWYCIFTQKTHTSDNLHCFNIRENSRSVLR